MKIKSIAISLMLIALTACASNAIKRDGTLKLMDGSSLVVDNGKVVKMIDKTGAVGDIKKGGMLELANGDIIYIRQDGTVDKMEESESSHGHHSNSSSGHSH